MTSNPEFNAVLLGALLMLTVVLLVVVVFGWRQFNRFARYASKFKGFQMGRNADQELTFAGKIDEFEPDEDDDYDDPPRDTIAPAEPVPPENLQ